MSDLIAAHVGLALDCYHPATRFAGAAALERVTFSVQKLHLLGWM